LNFIYPFTNKWRQVWIGSFANGQQDFFYGEYKDGAMRFKFNQANGQNNPLKGRFTFYNEGSDQVRQCKETSADNGKTGQLYMISLINGYVWLNNF
jgi:hypothetical protein